MRKYEFMLIIDPNKAAEINSVTETIKKHITDNNGNIISENNMGIRKLEYQVKKRDKGYYYLVEFEIDQKELPEIEKEIKLDGNIIKYLVSVLEK